jgi:hypothetical protein
MAVVTRVKNRPDSDAIRKDGSAIERCDTHQAFRISAHVMTHPIRKTRQPGPLKVEQQRDRAQHATCEDNTEGRASPLAHLTSTRPPFHVVTIAAIGGAARQNRTRFRRGPDLRASPLGQVQVVLDQRILGVVAAAHHASATKTAAATVRSRSAEVRIGRGHLRLPEVDADLGGRELIEPAEFFGQLAEREVAGFHARCGNRAEQAACGGIVRGKLGLPIGEMRPARRGEKARTGHSERVGVDE